MSNKRTIDIYIVINADTHENFYVTNTMEDCVQGIKDYIDEDVYLAEDSVHYDYSVYNRDTDELIDWLFVEVWSIYDMA